MQLRSFKVLLVRDGLILLATGGLWWLTPSSVTDHWILGTLSGLCFLLLHEWGHIIGAQSVGAVLKPGPVWGPLLFDVDTRANSREQFLALSNGGFVMSGLMLLAFWQWMPWNVLAGKIAWVSALTLATLTVLIEFPIAWRVYRGHPIPPVEIYQRR